MGGQNSGRMNITTEDWMREMELRIMHEERRPQIRSAPDVMGPGLGPKAVQIFDWNDEVTWFNGIFYSEHGALHAPDASPSNKFWMGYNDVNVNGEGYQRVYEFRGQSDDSVVATFVRRVTAVSGIRTWGPWVVVAGGGSGGTDEVWLGPNQPADTLELWVDTDDPTGTTGGTFVAPTLQSGWTNYAAAFNNAGYTKDFSGFVRLRGLVKDGLVGAIFTLPSGFTPLKTCIFNQIAGPGGARVDVIGPTGVVSLNTYVGTGNNGYVSLEGITFWPDGP